MTLRRAIQIASLLLFFSLLVCAVHAVSYGLALDLFLRMDPLLVAGTIIGGRVFALSFLPAIIVVGITPLFGRLFCGYVCPMGTTVCGADRILGAPRNKKGKKTYHRIKYFVLLFIIGAALLGVSFVFIASPIPLITRFYGLLIYPVLALFGDMGLRISRAAVELVGGPTIPGTVSIPHYATLFFVLFFFAGIFFASRFSRRFWCRYLCPSGGLLALFSRKPLWRRTVSSDCIDCGKCAARCPMGAIPEDGPETTRHSECIICRECEAVCPKEAVSFSFAAKQEASVPAAPLQPERRTLMLTGLAGVGTAAVSLTSLNSLYGQSGGVGLVEPATLLRPPGAMPEKDFLSLCVRCGECMAACPANALQPIWFDAGLTGLFSPGLVPRRGACNPECNACGTVCPTHAIREVPVADRRWAKVGTAMIHQNKCLAWEQQKRCMVCDEVCPYNAIEFKSIEGNPVPVPVILEERCTGCGLCEHHCPVRNQAAVVVTPLGAVREAEGSYEEMGRGQGLDISLTHKKDMEVQVIEEGGLAPGFDAL
jgi:MauM/NapG family ferredoxin protein